MLWQTACLEDFMARLRCWLHEHSPPLPPQTHTINAAWEGGFFIYSALFGLKLIHSFFFSWCSSSKFCGSASDFAGQVILQTTRLVNYRKCVSFLRRGGHSRSISCINLCSVNKSRSRNVSTCGLWTAALTNALFPPLLLSVWLYQLWQIVKHSTVWLQIM